MKKKEKNFVCLFLLGILVFSFFSGVLVSGEDNSVQINQNTWYAGIFNFFNLGQTLGEVILSLIIALIIFAAIYDILELVSIFQNNWVKKVIAIGLAFAAAMIGWVFSFARFMLGFAAGIGTIGIVLEILVAIGIFVGLSFGSNWAAKWAAKRKGQVEEVKAVKSAAQAKAAIRGLREIQEEFKRK